MQHAFRTNVLGLSQFKCAANFDVIFFPSHCLKPLALFIIRALWSEQHGNNVSRRHTPSMAHWQLSTISLFSLSPLFFSCPSVCCLNPQTSSILLLVLPRSLSLHCVPSHPSPLPLLSSFHQLFILFINFLSFYFLFDQSYLPLPHWFSSSLNVWPLISNSTINWSPISGWLIRGGGS